MPDKTTMTSQTNLFGTLDLNLFKDHYPEESINQILSVMGFGEFPVFGSVH